MADQHLDILFTAPHPDDLEIGMGGTIAKMVKLGHRVVMLHMTSGARQLVRHLPAEHATEPLQMCVRQDPLTASQSQLAPSHATCVALPEQAALPHPPQLRGSVSRLVQPPPQSNEPSGQLHTPELHTEPVLQPTQASVPPWPTQSGSPLHE